MTHLRLGRCTALLACFGLVSAACSHTVYSPPAHPIPVAEPRTLSDGQTAVRASGGTTSALFGPDVIAASASVARGLGHGTEASLGASVMHVQGSSAAGTSPDIIAGRAGAKQELLDHHMSAVAGLGAGHSAGGQFVSPDVGVIVGFDNEYLVPFVSGQAMGSFPMGARDVDVTIAGDPPGTHIDRPETTWGVGAAGGLRVPVGNPDSNRVHGGITGGMSFWKLYSDGEDEGFAWLSAGADIVF